MDTIQLDLAANKLFQDTLERIQDCYNMFGNENWAVEWAGPQLMPAMIATIEQDRHAEEKIWEEACKIEEAHAEAEQKAEEVRKVEEEA